MRRRTFDKTLSVTGFVLAGVLAVAGGLLLWGGTFAQSTVHDQLAAQRVTFTSDTTQLPPELQQYAGQSVDNGQLAKAYSDLISVHLEKMANGKTYSEVSAEWLAGGSKDAELGQLRTTMFMGETLRGMLLNAYAFSIFGTIAIIAAWVMFGAAAILLLLAILGLVHLRRTTDDVAIFAAVPSAPVGVRV